MWTIIGAVLAFGVLALCFTIWLIVTVFDKGNESVLFEEHDYDN